MAVFVGIKVGQHDDEADSAFRDAVADLPEVVSCYLLSGESDFLLQVVVPDLPAYERFLRGTLLKLPGITDIRSNFAISTVKRETGLSLAHLPGAAG